MLEAVTLPSDTGPLHAMPLNVVVACGIVVLVAGDPPPPPPHAASIKLSREMHAIRTVITGSASSFDGSHRNHTRRPEI